MADYKVVASSLHLRREPRIADNVVGFLHKNDVVQQLPTPPNGQFLKVRHGDLAGWCSLKWLKKIAPKAQRYVVIAEVSLNVRREPNAASKDLGDLFHGDVVTSDGSSPDGKWIHVKKGTLTGFASARFLRSVSSASTPVAPAGAGDIPAWFTIAEVEVGTTRLPGPADADRVLEYLQSTNLGRPANQNDETPWCSAFVNFCVEKSGQDGTNSALARNWLNWGHAITKPTKGCVVVLWRGSKAGTKGHVGFYVEKVNSTSFRILGGNQGDRVSKATFPTSRLLGFRML